MGRQQKGPAGISFGVTCRGSGKTYIQLRSNLSQTVHAWTSKAATSEGIEVPSQVAFTESGMPVVVLTVLRATQLVDVWAYDEAGNELAHASQVVRHERVKAASPANALLHRSLVEQMRQLGERRANERVWLGDYEVIRDRGEDLVHVTLSIEGTSAAVAQTRVDVRVLGINGWYIWPEFIKVLGDKTHRRDGVEGDYLRTMRISTRILAGLEGITLWVRFPDGEFEDCFQTIEPYSLRDLRIENWSQSTPAEVADNYHDWFLAHRATEASLAAQRAAQEAFAIRPTFSFVIPLYHTPIEYLRDAVASVLEQSYPRLELVLVNSTPEDGDLRAEVERMAASDRRVRVVELEGNYGITENTNYGIAAATGDFVSFMDHDDVIERDILYWYVRGINEYPTTDLLYCDEDLLVEGRYIHPVFKPDWSVLFEESNNYVCHMLTVRRSVLDELPTPTAELDGAQDHSMTLAAGERARNVYHARRVLYHWRSHPLSTAQNPDAKPESLDAGKLGIERHYERIGFGGSCVASKTWIHTYNTKVRLDAWPSLSVVVWGDERAAGACDNAACATDWLGAEFEREGVSPEVIEAERAEGQSWSAAVARSLGKATGDYVLLVSREVRSVGPTRSAGSADSAGSARPARKSWLQTLVAYAMRADAGVVAPRLLYADGLIASIGVTAVGGGGLRHLGGFMSCEMGNGHGYSRMQHDVTAVDPRCLVTRRELLEGLGGWNAGYDMDCACVDYCLRVHDANRIVGVLPAANVEVQVSPKPLDVLQSGEDHTGFGDYAALVRAWPGLIEADRFYSSQFMADGRFGFEGGWKWIIPLRPLDRIRYKVRY